MEDDQEASDMSPQVVTDQLVQLPPSLAPEASPKPRAAPRLTPSPPPLDPLPFVLTPPPPLPHVDRPVMAGGRRHPMRGNRTGPFGYTDPTVATREQAEDNFAILSTLVVRVAPAFAYQSPVDGH